MGVNRVIRLGVIDNLERLVFVLGLSRKSEFSVALTSLVQHFEDGLSEALQEVTIVVVLEYVNWRDALQLLSMVQGWAKLDEVLWDRYA